MKCLIYARIEELSWIEECFNKTNPYLLKIVNKPHLEYIIDFCSTLQIEDIRIVSNFSTSDLSAYFKDGKKWGVNISYNITKPEDSLKRVVLKNYSFCKDEDVLIISDYFFLEYDINKLQLNREGITANLRTVKGKNIQFLSKEDSIKDLVEDQENVHSDYFKLRVLNSVIDYYQLSMEIISDKCCQFALPGYSSEPKTYLGMNVTYPKSVVIHSPVMIGNNVRIGELVEIAGNSIIGDNIIIESLSSISNSIIYSDSFIGGDLEIDKKIVYHNKLISGITGQVIIMDDEYWIAGISKKMTIGKMQKSIHFVITLIQILIQTIPFILVSPFLLILHKKHNLTQIYYLSKEKEAKRMFSVDNVRKHKFIKFIKKMALDKYPYLFYVLSGRLSLVGSKMFPVDRKHKDILTNLPIYRPAVYSYWESLNQGFNSEVEIHELYYLNNNSFWRNIYIYCKINFLRYFW